MTRHGASRVGLLSPSAYTALVNTAIGDQRYHRCMPSDIPPGAVPPDPGQHWGPPPLAGSAPPVQTPPLAPMTFGRPARWPTFAALAIALIALAVGLVGWFRPVSHNNQPPPKPAYTDQQASDAKAKVCAAFAKLDRAGGVLVALAKNSDDLVGAINTRQVFDVFSRYLLATLAEEPATPADLATAVREQARTLEEVVIDYQDGYVKTDPEMRSVVDANSKSADTIRQLCK
jgi:hypothetical protein